MGLQKLAYCLRLVCCVPVVEDYGLADGEWQLAFEHTQEVDKVALVDLVIEL